MEDIKYWVWLSSLPGIGARRFKQLVDYFGSPQGVWNANQNRLREIRGLERLIPVIVDKKFKENLTIRMHRINELGIKLLRIIDEDYPENLKNIYDPPPLLYIRGRLEAADKKAVAIVGSRKATGYGKDMAKELACGLALRGITVISGMARGIDTCAHEGALEVGGRTVAVLGCGVDIAYPPENRNLACNILKSGAVISEFAVGMGPMPANFPARNRIISGLSMGTVVIEAGEKSGSLITAEFALEQGREVFAVPGNAKEQESKGANKLIKEGAKMVTCVEDILEEFSGMEYSKLIMQKAAVKEYVGLDDDERKIMENLDTEPVHIDDMSRRTEYNTQKINSLLTMLELKGILKQLPGKFFIRA